MGYLETSGGKGSVGLWYLTEEVSFSRFLPLPCPGSMSHAIRACIFLTISSPRLGIKYLIYGHL